MESISLLQLNKRLASLVAVPETQDVWVTAELSDVAVRGGHCYMELLQKDTERGTTVARARGIIWASHYSRIDTEFYVATGQRFATGIKVMVRASATMHPVYGISLVITAVNPEYTMGDLLRRRQEMLMRLKKEGILEMNRQLTWPDVVMRIAVISAPGAAGYGDFINQLYNNPSKLRFVSRLFPAVMQGERAPLTIISALENIASDIVNWDCVVLIRGGGATSDLVAFEDYELAANIAQFPLPVIIGIGHERDITILDYVANMRVKTPTAAAEWLISRGVSALERLRRAGADMLQAVSDKLSGCLSQLSYYEGLLPVAPVSASERAAASLQKHLLALASVGSRRLSPEMARLDQRKDAVGQVICTRIDRQMMRIDSLSELVGALSPQATLRRGYSITRVDGKAVTSVTCLPQGTEIETTFADGNVISIVK